MPAKANPPTTVALALCGSLALGLTGTALAVEPLEAAPKPRPVAAPAPAVTARMALLGSLGTLLTLGTGIARDAHAARPDAARLKLVQRQLAEEGARLLASARAQAQQAPATAKNDPKGNRRKDPVGDIRTALDQLGKDATRLLNDLAANNTAAVSADVTQVLADLTKLTALVPQVGGGLPGVPAPVPPLPVPVGR
ncbi:hypothetical protein [Streptomyces caatingaensis]|uniref:Uncharacterized protein n=1 Tax=Streptomyces caatingaensis TaxID=1678637 RepID=A0A0K9XGZ5_9ACTN|nr:hypothetical protein [Streptomyces caatingaensis]KNB52341.1 hypothetical protein AC230_12450 [Streptomyces caatingaensis]